MISLLALVLAAAALQAEKFEYALPVGRGTGNNGPFLIQAWPAKGCAACTVDAEDAAALDVVIKDLKAAVGAAPTYPEINFRYVTPRPLADSAISIDQVREMIAGCSFGTAGILSPYPTWDVTAFGVRFDCDATKTTMWMSVVMNKHHHPTLAYLVPNYPSPLMKAR